MAFNAGGHGERTGRVAHGRRHGHDAPKKSMKEALAALPEVWQLLRPRRNLILVGLLLTGINQIGRAHV